MIEVFLQNTRLSQWTALWRTERSSGARWAIGGRGRGEGRDGERLAAVVRSRRRWESPIHCERPLLPPSDDATAATADDDHGDGHGSDHNHHHMSIWREQRRRKEFEFGR